MNNLVLKESELNLISRLQNYMWIGLLKDGKLLLKDKINQRKVIGEIATSTTERAPSIQLQLHHENINRVLEILCINDRMKISISPFIGNSIATLIHEDSFNKDPRCFDRKKSYAKDILSALSYMHQNSVFHLSLSDENIAICTDTDKAKLCDFSYAFAQKKVTKQLLPENRFFMPPEVENGGDSETFDSLPIDMWDCGILLLQIFTQHQLPVHGMASESVEFLGVEILQKANSGVSFNEEIVNEFEVFIQDFLSELPDLRPSAKEALQSRFLQTSNNRLYEKARRSWMSGINQDSVIEIGRFSADSLSASDVDVVNLTHKDDVKLFDKGDINGRYPKTVGSCLTWTKYDSHSTHREVPHPPLPENIRFPPRNYDEESSNSEKESHHGNYLTEWEIDDPLLIKEKLEDLLKYSETAHNKKNELAPPCSLEQIIPYIISKTDVNLSDPFPNSRNFAPETLEEFHPQSDPNIFKVGMDELFDVSLKNSNKAYSFQPETNSSDKKKREKKVSVKDSLDLTSRKSVSKILKKSDSLILIDKSDLYEISQTGIAEGRQKIAMPNRLASDQYRSCEIAVRQRKKWYYKLFCCCK